MAILSRDDFFKALHDRMPDATGEDDISFLENMTDTYNELENRALNDNEDWKRKYEENDKAWREKYKHRFFNGGDRAVPSSPSQKEDDDYSPEDITIDDLFK